MAGKKISQLPVLPVAPQLTDIFPEVQPAVGGITYQCTFQQLLTLFQQTGDFPYTDVTATSQLMSPNNGYGANNGALVTLTLPVLAAVGTRLEISGVGAGGFLIAQNAGQNIQIGSSSSTIGIGGSVASTNRWDSLELLCVVANTTWSALSGPQSSGLTIV